MAFSPTNENAHLVTLTGGPEWALILWKWDQIQILSEIKIDPVGPISGMAEVSFAPDNSSPLIVTGGGLYKFFSVKEKSIEEMHSAMNSKPETVGHSFTCHTWSSAG